MLKLTEGKTEYLVNEDNIEYLVKVGREWLVHFVSGASLKVRSETAKEIIEGYAKKREKIQR